MIFLLKTTTLQQQIPTQNLELRGQGTGHVYLENIGVIDETITTRHGDSTQPIWFNPDANFTVSSTGSLQFPRVLLLKE